MIDSEFSSLMATVSTAQDFQAVLKAHRMFLASAVRLTMIENTTGILRFTMLCCAVLCCAVLCRIVLCCAVLCCAVLCFTMLCCAVQHCTVLLCTLLSYAVLVISYQSKKPIFHLQSIMQSITFHVQSITFHLQSITSN